MPTSCQFHLWILIFLWHDFIKVLFLSAHNSLFHSSSFTVATLYIPGWLRSKPAKVNVLFRVLYTAALGLFFSDLHLFYAVLLPFPWQTVHFLLQSYIYANHMSGIKVSVLQVLKTKLPVFTRVISEGCLWGHDCRGHDYRGSGLP